MYTAAKTILIAKWVDLIDNHKFAKAALKEVSKTFVIYVAALETPSKMIIHLSQATQIFISWKLA